MSGYLPEVLRPRASGHPHPRGVMQKPGLTGVLGSLGDVLVAARPSAVVVNSQRPQPNSARNTWPATVAGLTLLADRIRST